MMIKFLLFLVYFVSVFTFEGFSLIDYFQQDQVKECLRQKGYQLNIQSIKENFNINQIIHNMIIAKSVNMTSDLLFYADSQTGKIDYIDRFLEKIPINLYATVWIDVDHYFISNCFYLKQSIQKIKSKGKKVGISTNIDDWNKVMGKQCLQIGQQPLMYTGTNFQPNFDDFVPFGGWQKPAIKIYDVDFQCQAMFSKIYLP